MSAAPEQPKKVTGGAFGRFLAANRPALQKELAGKPGSEVTKLASQRFKAISEGERSEWEKKYKDAQAQHPRGIHVTSASSDNIFRTHSTRGPAEHYCIVPHPTTDCR